MCRKCLSPYRGVFGGDSNILWMNSQHSTGTLSAESMCLQRL